MAGLTKEQIAAKRAAQEAELMDASTGGAVTMTTTEYAEYSKANGRNMGRAEGQVTVLTTQELRVLLNASWKPSMIIEKHGISKEKLQQVVWGLSEEELRGKRPIEIDFDADMFKRIR